MELVYFCCWIAFSATISINDTTRMWGEECTIHKNHLFLWIKNMNIYDIFSKIYSIFIPNSFEHLSFLLFSFSYLFIMIYSMIETEQMVLSFFDYDPQKKFTWWNREQKKSNYIEIELIQLVFVFNATHCFTWKDCWDYHH